MDWLTVVTERKFAIGDPSFMGWLTVVAYFTAGILSARVFFSAEKLFYPFILPKQKLFWLLITLVMLFLGINKQLDLQSFLTAVARYYAVKDGWYENRRIVQLIFILTVIISSVCAMLFAIWSMKNTFETNGTAILGLCLLAIFILIRAVSFHHVDRLINISLLGIRMNWILELTGIILIAGSAVSIIRQQSRYNVTNN